MAWLLAALCAQVLIGVWVPSAWWAPDLMLLTLLLLLFRDMESWLHLSLVAGLLMALMAVRHPQAAFLAYAATGVLLRVASRSWNFSEARTQSFAVLAASLAVSASALVSQGRPALIDAASLGARVALTVLAFWIARAALERWRRRWATHIRGFNEPL